MCEGIITIMFSSNHKRILIGLMLLFPIILSPSAIADQPVKQSILNKTLCESWGATWKNASCNVSISVSSSTSFKIEPNTSLVINEGVYFTQFGNVANNGSIQNFGILNFQPGWTIFNDVKGIIVNRSTLYWYSGILNSGKLLNYHSGTAVRYQYTENRSTGTIYNFGNWIGGCVDKNLGGTVEGICVS